MSQECVHCSYQESSGDSVQFQGVLSIVTVMREGEASWHVMARVMVASSCSISLYWPAISFELWHILVMGVND